MNRLFSLFFGIALLFFAAWLGLVAYSYLQLGCLKSFSGNDGIVPLQYDGRAILGAQVYAANGCVTCHSQQVRQTDVTRSDIERKWGNRPSVPRDYMRDRTAFLGISRIGPDLSNVGMRFTEATWYYQHLYEPNVVVPGSTMPAYRYLFRLQKIQGERSQEAVPLIGSYAPAEGYEVVPTQDAKNLVAYLLSLKHDYTLPEVSVEPAPAN